MSLIELRLIHRQFDFWNRNFTVQQVYRLVDKISYTSKKKQICTGAFIDIA